jgi:hypothetical protein
MAELFAKIPHEADALTAQVLRGEELHHVKGRVSLNGTEGLCLYELENELKQVPGNIYEHYPIKILLKAIANSVTAHTPLGDDTKIKLLGPLGNMLNLSVDDIKTIAKQINVSENTGVKIAIGLISPDKLPTPSFSA